MDIPFLNNIKSGLIRGEILKSLNKLDPSLTVPAINNVLESVGLVEIPKQKDRAAVKQAIKNKLMEFIRALDGS
jgi:hypothetical protein